MVLHVAMMHCGGNRIRREVTLSCLSRAPGADDGIVVPTLVATVLVLLLSMLLLLLLFMLLLLLLLLFVLFTGGWLLPKHLIQVRHDLQLMPPFVLSPREVTPPLGGGRGRGTCTLGGRRGEEGGSGE